MYDGLFLPGLWAEYFLVNNDLGWVLNLIPLRWNQGKRKKKCVVIIFIAQQIPQGA